MLNFCASKSGVRGAPGSTPTCKGILHKSEGGWLSSRLQALDCKPSTSTGPRLLGIHHTLSGTCCIGVVPNQSFTIICKPHCTPVAPIKPFAWPMIISGHSHVSAASRVPSNINVPTSPDTLPQLWSHNAQGCLCNLLVSSTSSCIGRS